MTLRTPTPARLGHIGRLFGLLGGILLWLLISAGCDLKQLSLSAIDLKHFDASETVTQQIAYSGQRIVLENLLGTIRVEGASEEPGFVAVRPLINLEAVKKVRGMDLSDLKVVVDQDEKEIHVHTEASASLRRELKLLPPRLEDHIGWIEYTLKVPQGVILELDQQAGSIRVAGVQGQLTLSSQLGDLVVEQATLESGRLSTELGGVKVNAVSAKEITISTELGGISISSSQFEQARLDTQAGSIKLQDTILRDGRLSTQMGSIDLANVSGALIKADTQMGSIGVKLPQSASVKLEAETQLGRIKVNGLDRQVPIRRSGDGSLSALLNEGHDRLVLSTQLGSIKIELMP
jgi:hypothetical protein